LTEEEDRNMAHNKWTIAPLILATAVRDKSQSLLLRDYGIKVKGGVLAWLLRNGNDKILVDTGACGPIKTSHFNSRFDQTPEQTLEFQLRRFDTSFDEIATVINTHLHLDHCAGNVHFKRSVFFVQRREIEYAQNPLPVHRSAYGADISSMSFEILEGDAEIMPGIKVILTPGHSPGSQAVLVDTAEGLYVIAGDTVTYFENMVVPESDSFWPNAIYVDLREYYESLNRLKGLGGFILPGHDLLVLNKDIYP
jgi:N-acyl homoserine lactone hydrolase